MKLLTSGIILLASTGLLLGACSQATKTSDSASTSSATPTAKTAPPATTTAQTESSAGGQSNKGGQVVESGKYHLEFVPLTSKKDTHLDLYLQKGDTHAAIPNAKVTADIQLPDGKLKTISLSYDTSN